MNLFLFLLSFVLVLIGCGLFTNGVEWAGRRFRLSEGAVGSVLAAVGTGLPETIVPVIAILLIGGEAGEEIGTGAILGSPFTLSSIALFIGGMAILLFARRRRTGRLQLEGGLLRRDISLFLITYGLAASAALVPLDYGWIKAAIGLVLIPLYIGYTIYSFRTGKKADEDEGLENLYLSSLLRKPRPGVVLIAVQVLLSLLIIVTGAELFVGEIKEIAPMIGISPLILALIVSPLATELPEMLNSLLWIREKKDTYALGNITGAMVYQSCVPVTIGIWLTGWHLDLGNSVGQLLAMAIAFTLLSAMILRIFSTRKEIGVPGLFLGGILYFAFVALVLQYA